MTEGFASAFFFKFASPVEDQFHNTEECLIYGRICEKGTSPNGFAQQQDSMIRFGFTDLKIDRNLCLLSVLIVFPNMESLSVRSGLGQIAVADTRIVLWHHPTATPEYLFYFDHCLFSIELRS